MRIDIKVFTPNLIIYKVVYEHWSDDELGKLVIVENWSYSCLDEVEIIKTIWIFKDIFFKDLKYWREKDFEKRKNLCITCGINEAINNFYKECVGCIEKHVQSKERDKIDFHSILKNYRNYFKRD